MAIQSSNPFELHTFEQWGGLNQQAKRGSIGDNEEWWNENLFAIGPGNLRSCWGPLQDSTGNYKAIYTAPAGRIIRRIFFGFIGNETPQFNVPPPGRLGWMFLDDGTIDQVDLDTGTVTHVGGAGRQVWNPIGPQYWASAVVWRPQLFGNQAGSPGGVLFGSPEQTDVRGGLFAWDGTTLSSPWPAATPDPAPDWLTSGITPVGGGTFPMPSGLPGIFCMEVYQSRLWVSGKDVISFSAPSNGADFATVDGGGSFGYFGNKLTYTFNDLAAMAGYLYCIGDSSIDMIANVQVTGGPAPTNPVTTTFNYVNIDPQVGQRFPRPVGRIGRYFQTWNGAGIFECRGGEAGQISSKVTNILNTLALPQSPTDNTRFLPTMCTATMFGFKVLLCLGIFNDIFGLQRPLLLMWHPGQGPFWSVASQNIGLQQIGSYEQDSVITPYGTDGKSLYQLFAQPDHSLLKYLATKFVRGLGSKQVTIKNWKRMFLEFHDEFGGGVSFIGKLTTFGGGVPGGVQSLSFDEAPGEFALAPPQNPPGGVSGTAVPRSQDQGAFEPQRTEGQGIAGGVDVWSISPDFTIERLHVGTEDRTLFGA